MFRKFKSENFQSDLKFLKCKVPTGTLGIAKFHTHYIEPLKGCDTLINNITIKLAKTLQHAHIFYV